MKKLRNLAEKKNTNLLNREVKLSMKIIIKQYKLKIYNQFKKVQSLINIKIANLKHNHILKKEVLLIRSKIFPKL